jgi:hypothetical protein
MNAHAQAYGARWLHDAQDSPEDERLIVELHELLYSSVIPDDGPVRLARSLELA